MTDEEAKKIREHVLSLPICINPDSSCPKMITVDIHGDDVHTAFCQLTPCIYREDATMRVDDTIQDIADCLKHSTMHFDKSAQYIMLFLIQLLQSGRLIILDNVYCDGCRLSCGDCGTCGVTGYPSDPRSCCDTIRKETIAKIASAIMEKS